MKVYGALESAQAEWFTNAGKPAASSYPYRMIYVTDLRQMQVSDGTQWRVIGSRLDTYTSGTIPAAASNSNAIIWVSDLEQVQISNGSAWVQVGSKAGTKNYFSQNNANADFETNSVIPWSACTLTFSSGVPSGAPTLTATQMSIATTATTPLSGTYSMLLTKSAANAQYQGFISGALTIDREDTAKVLYGSFYYEVVSGTIDLSGSSTQSLEIWIYNTVSGQWTQPAGYRGMNQSSGVGRVVFSFQTDGTYANNAYKIAVITQQTSTSSYVVEFDDFVVGPQAIVLGSAMTDWQSYTPTFTGFGTPTAITCYWKRNGDSIEIKGKFTSGTPTAVQAQISFPSNLSTDANKISTVEIVGAAEVGALGVVGQSVSSTFATLSEQNVQYITFSSRSSGTTGLSKLTGSAMSSLGTVFSFYARVPIAGWGSFSQMSSDTDTRVVAFEVRGQFAGMDSTTNAKFNSITKLIDTHGAYNSSTGIYTVPVSGWYRITTNFDTGTGANAFRTHLYKGGVLDTFLGYGYSGGVITSTDSYCNAGEQLSIRSVSSMASYTSPCGMSIERLSGPSVITATETVTASYCISAAAATAINVQFNFDSKVFDSHNAVTTGAGAWKFTAPISGKYKVTTSIINGAATNNTMTIFKNGSIFRNMGYNIVNSVTGGSIPGVTLVQLNAGDYIDVRSGSNTVTPIAGVFSGATLSNSNFIDIIRVGN